MLGTATDLPFADDSFDVVFSSFGALQFVSDIDGAVAETARVLRPGGRFAFSITHPTRWMFPDDPGEDGLVATQSYWDRTPYVEVDDATGQVSYVEHHRTLGDWVALLAAAGLRAHRPPRARVARGPRPGLGRLVGDPGPVHAGHRDLRGEPQACWSSVTAGSVGAVSGSFLRRRRTIRTTPRISSGIPTR